MDFEPIAPSAFLTEALKRFVPLATAINTEKARSEYLIAPILSEIVTLNPQASLFSGKSFTADPSMGLNGFVDFLLTANPDKLAIKAPIVRVIEAKNENHTILKKTLFIRRYAKLLWCDAWEKLSSCFT
jgi:hypothetical protein